MVSAQVTGVFDFIFHILVLNIHSERIDCSNVITFFATIVVALTKTVIIKLKKKNNFIKITNYLTWRVMCVDNSSTRNCKNVVVHRFSLTFRHLRYGEE